MSKEKYSVSLVFQKLGDRGIHQLYTDGVKWVESDIHDLLEIPDYLIEKGFDVKETHKATLEELINHFKL